MPTSVRLTLLTLLAALALPAFAAVAAPPGAEALARVLPSALRPDRHPRLFVSPEDLVTGRRNANSTPWGRGYLAKQKSAAARFVALDDAALRALVPQPGSLFVYGLGMNLDPVQKQRMTWTGWDDPFAMRAADGTRYPNAAWPDTGDGVVDPQSKERSEMRPVAGKSGAFTFAAGISRFYSGGSRPNTRYALGKAVYAGDTFIGRIRRIDGRNQQVTIEGPGLARVTSPTSVRVLETAEGDAVTVPVNLTWSATP